MKLTDKQIQHLRVLCGGETSSYSAGLHMGVLQSLERKGAVSARRGLGSMAMPRTSIKWRITDAGREALKTATREL